jgi:hypothetical protein
MLKIGILIIVALVLFLGILFYRAPNRNEDDTLFNEPERK